MKGDRSRIRPLVHRATVCAANSGDEKVARGQGRQAQRVGLVGRHKAGGIGQARAYDPRHQAVEDKVVNVIAVSFPTEKRQCAARVRAGEGTRDW